MLQLYSLKYRTYNYVHRANCDVLQSDGALQLNRCDIDSAYSYKEGILGGGTSLVSINDERNTNTAQNYAQAKLANIMLVRELTYRLPKNSRVYANAARAWSLCLCLLFYLFLFDCCCSRVALLRNVRAMSL